MQELGVSIQEQKDKNILIQKESEERFSRQEENFRSQLELKEKHVAQVALFTHNPMSVPLKRATSTALEEGLPNASPRISRSVYEWYLELNVDTRH